MNPLKKSSNYAMIFGVIALVLVIIATLMPFTSLYPLFLGFFSLSFGVFALHFSREVLTIERNEIPDDIYQRTKTSQVFALIAVLGTCARIFWLK